MYIIIIGCGRLGSMLAEDLSDAGYNISIVDREAKNLDTLGSGFNGLRIKGIEFDNDVLLEAGIKHADYIISATSDDNINITVALIAQKIFKVPRIIARINNPKKKPVYDGLGIETINPTELSVYILKSRIEETLK
ncbi:MAG: TrkA family potassium uptake protein [Acidaminococcaceae bacterium]|nr:TrkA family potassium uptake protein [Acidaminococcaceae bacterium]MDD4721601.1 TrkA family potassium uptake protein [Acidaminococcaceae bacterium]